MDGLTALELVKECLENVRDNPDLWSCTQEEMLGLIVTHLEEKINGAEGSR